MVVQAHVLELKTWSSRVTFAMSIKASWKKIETILIPCLEEIVNS